MKLLFPVFGVLFATASCCCFGDQNPFAENLPKPVQPLRVASADEPDGSVASSTLPAEGKPGPMPVDPPSEQPSVPQPATPPPTEPKPDIGAIPAAPTSGTHEGVLKTGSSTLVVLTTTGGSTPPVGATGTLSKWVTKKIMGADVTMWLNIANVSVTAVEGDSVTLSVKEVTFDATVNGKKVNPFEKGVKTQLEWEK